MSTKPTGIVEWATDATYSSGVQSGEDTKIEPDASTKAEGFQPASYPRPEHFNWMLNLLGLWSEYLSDGAFTGPISVSGTLTTDDLAVTDDATVAGDLTVTGAFKHGEVTLNIPGSAGIPEDSGTTDYDLHGYSGSIDVIKKTGTTDSTITYPVPLKVGDRVKSVAIRVIGVTAGVDVDAADAMIRDANSNIQTAGTAGVTNVLNLSTVTPTTITLTPASPTALAVNQHFVVALIMSGTGVADNGTGMRILGVDVTYDRP